MRAVLIGVGSVIVTRFEWILYIFALFLIAMGLKMLLIKTSNTNIKDNVILKFIRKYLPITDEIHDEKFYILKKNDQGIKKIYYTPLFVALILIESVDLIFAIDSIPAIFSITTDPYIVYTSNIFAILGLRSLYFALASILKIFTYLKHSLALVLIFIGSKIYIKDLLGLEKFPASISLSITLGLIAGGIILSLYSKNKTQNAKK
jgi:tellurite resistance protein TerC